ncbi:MAG: hypothetical protein IT357_16485 [Gemmatimonadaceae bacterium]|nr:hypothetical protein [Gemmatimonadaceae bacterium]
MIDRLLRGVLGFDRLQWVLPLAVLLLYLPSGLFGVYFFDGDAASRLFLVILAVALGSYAVGYRLMSWVPLEPFLQRSARLQLTPELLIIAVFGPYLLFVAYSAATAPGIPLVEAVRGASPAQIAIAREQFMKARSGGQALLVYMNALFTVAIIPYTVCLLYRTQHRLRHILLGVAVFTLLLSLEKSLVLRVMLPLLALAVNGQLRLPVKSPAVLLGLMGVAVVGVTFLAIGRNSVDSISLAAALEDNPTLRTYFLANPDNALLFAINRALWIAYVTAYDWLRYFLTEMDSRPVWGASSSLVAALTGAPRINLERAVYEFEWGQNETGTGSANAAYFIDAFANFGWAGVILSSFVVAAIARLFVASDNPDAKAAFVLYALFLSVSGIFGVLFSSGLILLLGMTVMLRPPASGLVAR